MFHRSLPRTARLLPTCALLLAALWGNAQQEDNCNNGVDDDDDILTDCADFNCQAECDTAFPCMSASHLFQVVEGRDLREWVVDAWVPVATYTAPTDPDDRVNAMGYNVQDGYIYGIRYPNRLIRITRNGMWDLGAVTGLPTLAQVNGVDQGYHTGDMNLNGELYVSNRYQTNMWVVDVSSVSVVATVPLVQSGSAETLDMLDFAYIPSAEMFVGMRVSDRNKLRRIEPDGTVWASVNINSVHPMYDACPNAGYGAAFADVSGRLYVYCNEGGTSFFKITLDNTTWDDGSLVPAELDAVSLGTGLASMTNNDGAACPLGCGLDEECCPGLELVQMMKPGSRPTAAEAQRMKDRIAELEDELAAAKDKAAVLVQNKPNPFNERCTIQYGFKDLHASSASISVFALNGTLVKTYPIEIVEQGTLVIEASTMQPGTYLYTLVADGREVDTKRMILLGD